MSVLVVAKRGVGKSLCVVFNDYKHKAFVAADKPFCTYLQGIGMFSRFSVPVIWFAENTFSWYTLYEDQTLAFLKQIITENGFESVTLLGSSCGGYAALRHALRLSADETLQATFNTVVLNPQTGFSRRLLRSVRAAREARGREFEELGINPIVLNPLCYDPQTTGVNEIDVSDLAARLGDKARCGMNCIFYDSLNPMEVVFAEDCANVPNVVMQPVELKVDHAEGVVTMFQILRESTVIERLLGINPVHALPAGAPKSLHEFAAIKVFTGRESEVCARYILSPAMMPILDDDQAWNSDVRAA